MTKIMLVEDDNSLREIYTIRLTAEGYAIVSAGDGEEALAVAVKERPDLIISDVMMPKISGFDMLDILKSTPETKDIKTIMMTALSSEDQRERGENLGADRYLVKSQVGIEDVVNVVHDVLGDRTKDGTIDTNANAEPGSAPAAQPSAEQASASAAPVAPQATTQPTAATNTSQAPVTEPQIMPPEPAPVPQDISAPMAAAPQNPPMPSPTAEPQPTPPNFGQF